MTTPNPNPKWAARTEYDGSCAATDMSRVAGAIEGLIHDVGAMPELSTVRLARQILLYVSLRRSGLCALEIGGPHHLPTMPSEWDGEKEKSRAGQDLPARLR